MRWGGARESFWGGCGGGREFPPYGLERRDDEFVAGLDVDVASEEAAGNGVGDGLAVGVEAGDFEVADDAGVAADGEFGAFLGIVVALDVDDGEAVIDRVSDDGGDEEGFLDDAGAAAVLVGFLDVALSDEAGFLFVDVGLFGDLVGLFLFLGDFGFEGGDPGGVFGGAVGLFDGKGGGGDGSAGISVEGELPFGGIE